jgi:hypothetical protein
MKDNSVQSTPLKLYHKAYSLHYSEHKIAKACIIYEQIIREFPDAEVSAYASIQLQKIRAGKIARSLGFGRGLSLPVILILIFNTAAVIALSTIIAVAVLRIKQQWDRQIIIEKAIARMYSGHEDAALELLKEAKISNPDDVVPFMLSAEIYRKNSDFVKARHEYETYGRINPQDSITDIEIKSINDEEVASFKKTKKAKEEEKLKAREKAAQEKALAEEAEEKTEEKSRPKPKPVTAKPKTKLLVPADSIAFF